MTGPAGSPTGAPASPPVHTRAPYYLAFAALAVLTVAEIGVVYVPGIARALLIVALVLLALAKAGLVMLVFMHLGREVRGLKLGVLAPFLLPAIYAVVLIAEAMWRGHQ
jgi:caa(3)-type oxidase subunit IV